MYDLFIDTLDAIYWPGYTEQLALDNPEKLFFELQDFLENYDN